MSNDTFVDTFREEALELLGTLETALLELEENPQDKELLSAVFRVMHTIKGSAAMFGLDKISKFAHEVESILSALREGKLSVSKELIGNTLLARDLILEMLDNLSEATGPLSSKLLDFLKNFKLIIGFVSVEEKVLPEIQKDKKGNRESKERRQTYHIVFKPGIDSFRRGCNPLLLIQELMSLGEVVNIPVFDQITDLESLDPESCLVSWEIYITTTATENELRDVFIFVEDFSEIHIKCLDNLIDESGETNKRVGEILIEQGKLSVEDLDSLLGSQKRIGELLVEEKLVSATDLKVALESQKQIQQVQKNKALHDDMSTIRVKSEKLDELMALVGELVTVHAQILQTSKTVEENEKLNSVVEQFGRLTDELRNNTMSIRMVPIGTTFSSFKRLVRDLSSELGKNVVLEADGGETELDKTVIEKLNDPLVHIIRNSLDHGIESPEVRSSRGKPKTGTIRLSAIQSGASVYISIEDDGNGLNKEAILKKAITKGIVAPDAQLEEQAVFRLIFAPGFSTKEAVSAVSGRGVGMDVVNRQMEIIGGSLAIESEETKFSRITLKIPLTLAIVEGLLVRIGLEHFIVPLSVVVGCMEFIQADQRKNSSIVLFQDRQLPFVNMREFFSIPGERNSIEQIVIVTIKDQQFGLLVDQIIGGNQTVIKPLGKLFRNATGISNGSILGDGSVALIIDVEQIIGSLETINND